MTTIALFRPPRRRSSWLYQFAAIILIRGGELWRAMRNRRSVSALLAWDDRALHDIGLTRGDVQSAMASPMGDDPSRHLDSLWRERRLAFRAEASARLARRRSRAGLSGT